LNSVVVVIVVIIVVVAVIIVVLVVSLSSSSSSANETALVWLVHWLAPLLDETFSFVEHRFELSLFQSH
jgi:hypothetical protein